MVEGDRSAPDLLRGEMAGRPALLYPEPRRGLSLSPQSRDDYHDALYNWFRTSGRFNRRSHHAHAELLRLQCMGQWLRLRAARPWRQSSLSARTHVLYNGAYAGV